jgi:caffeoyl-CoA O-methyltransferase
MVRGVKTGLSPDSLMYLAGLATRTNVLARVERETAEMPRSMMQVSPDQGALLQVLVAAVGAKNVLEVGTFTGYSAICIARGLVEGGTLTCLELEDEYADIAQRNIEAAGVEDRVDIVRGRRARRWMRCPRSRCSTSCSWTRTRPATRTTTSRSCPE